MFCKVVKMVLVNVVFDVNVNVMVSVFVGLGEVLKDGYVY